MTVRVTWDVEERLLADEAVRGAVEAALAHGGRPGLDVDVVLVDDETLAELHGQFLDDPTPTDVMAFDLGADDAGSPAPADGSAEGVAEAFEAQAEIYASVDCARRVALERNEEPPGELRLYLVHGTLHLCGFDDHTDEDRAAMRAAEAAVLARLDA